MKINKLTSTLIALGVISLASAAQANTVIYLTGSTAARSVVAAALQGTGVFSAAPTVLPTGASPTGNVVVFEGSISGISGTVDIVCSWTGSEAGIASVAGKTISQSVNGGAFNLPGSPAQYPTFNGTSWDTNNLTTVSQSDLAMADTSQAVSLTPTSIAALHSFGNVGVVPFTFVKGYNSTGASDTSWTDLINVTTAEINQNLAGPLTANIYTGKSADSDNVVIVGRNEGSGTRVNTELNSAEFAVGSTVDQWAYDVSYPSGTPGVLTFGGSFAAGQGIQEVGNDGFDGGTGVAQQMQVDGSGSGNVLIGYLGVSDAKNATTLSKYATGAKGSYLTFNGVYEGDQNVINGSYTYWGQEHLYGQPTPNAADTTVGTKLASAIHATLLASGGSITGSAAAGAATGDVSTNPSQSILIPLSLMQVGRTKDSGFPQQGGSFTNP
jgi:hypothetical protein